jgi:thiamine-monophosphate kinase
VRETDLLRRIAERSADLPTSFPRVLVGPGDDCAVLDASDGPLAVTVDQLVEGRHFEPGTPVDLIARKAVARSVSDLAAMAAWPAWGLVTAVLPPGYAHADELAAALAAWGRSWSLPIVGGDVATGPAGSPIVLTCTAAGTAHASRGPVLRSGAQIGDRVYVTGRLGRSFPSGRHLRFEPRIVEARALADALGLALHAMIDLSDGLGIDAGRVAEASGVRIELEASSLPKNDGADLDAALGDGEDYELLLVVDAGARPPILPCGVTEVGRVVAGRGCVVRTGTGDSVDASNRGWEHR